MASPRDFQPPVPTSPLHAARVKARPYLHDVRSPPPSHAHNALSHPARPSSSPRASHTHRKACRVDRSSRKSVRSHSPRVITIARSSPPESSPEEAAVGVGNRWNRVVVERVVRRARAHTCKMSEVPDQRMQAWTWRASLCLAARSPGSPRLHAAPRESGAFRFKGAPAATLSAPLPLSLSRRLFHQNLKEHPLMRS